MSNEDLSQLKIDKTSTFIRPRRQRKVFYIAAAVLLAAVLIGLYFEGLLSPAVEVEATNVTQIYPSQTFTLLNASGYVVAQRKAAAASKVTGRLVSLSVEEGSHVKEGQVLARLENDDVTASMERAAANLEFSKTDLERAKAEIEEAVLSFNRNRDLLLQGLVTQAAYDASDARYKKAAAAVASAEAAIKAGTAALKEAEVFLAYTIIRAPFEGVVLTKNADIGDIVTPLGAAANAKAAVVTMADMNSLQVEVDVSESNLQQVKQGQPCEIQLDAFPESRFKGEVHMIVPTADRSKASVMVKIRFLEKDSRILPEMGAKAAFLQRPLKSGEERPRTVINPDAVITRNGSKSVFLIKDNRAVETPVTLGEQLGDMVEVLHGVKSGDSLILKPLDKIKDGTRVKVAE